MAEKEDIKKLRLSYPILTKYEKARIIGIRIAQLENGSQPFVTIYKEDTLEDIALRELSENKLPLKIRRPLPNGKYEIWKLSELTDLD